MSVFVTKILKGGAKMRTKKIRITTKVRPTTNGNIRLTTSVSNGSSTKTRTKTIRVK